MDSRDSSTSASTVNRDGSSADDDSVLCVTAGLAKDAALLFQSRKFAECVDVLNQLQKKKEDDPKVLHNIAVAEYFRDVGSDPKKLLLVLRNIKKKAEELASASVEHVEAVNNLGNKVISGSKGANAMAHQISATNSVNIVYDDEFDNSVTALNIAVIHFHLHEYKKALSILEPLYMNIEPIDERTALHICFLLLDVALALNDASRSADVINYLEKAFGVGNTANPSETQQQSSTLVAKSFSVPNNSTALDASPISDPSLILNSSENALSRTLSEETLDYETLLSTLDIGGRNPSRPPSHLQSNDLSRVPVDCLISTADLKLSLHLYKVRLFLLTRNLKAAKREVKMAMNIARGRDSSTALLLKSQLEYARGNHRKAIKLLMASGNKNEASISSIFNNNLGCIHHQIGKHHTSTVFFCKALKNSLSLTKDKPLKLLNFSQDKSLLIVYNCGVQYLACGKPLLAARCFYKASSVFYDRPLLWVRIAECCLMAQEKGLLRKVCGDTFDRSEIRVHVIGQGKYRQLLVEDGISKSGNLNSFEKDAGVLGDDKQPKLSISLARQTLLNAIHLLNCCDSMYMDSTFPSSTSTEENEANSKVSNATINSNGGLNTTLHSSVSDYEQMCSKENEMVRQGTLAHLAFVELELENPLKALSTARSLLKLPECSGIYMFLGNVYAAEALCLLNRPKEAAEYLSVYLSQGQTVEVPFREEDREIWRVEKTIENEENANSSSEESQGILFLKPEEAQGVLHVNLAATSAIQGDLGGAQFHAMSALSIIPNRSEAILTAIYVDLLLGKANEAVSKLKQCSHIRFLPTTSILKSSF